jgi:hypothetical protein
MKRRTFDTLMTAGGAVVVIVLVIAGTLLFVGFKFANDTVTSQLSQQKIVFPEKGSESLKDPLVGPFLNRYAGQTLKTGAQAEAYANHFIQVHIKSSGKGTAHAGLTYAELGTYNTKIKAQIAALPATDPSLPALQKDLADATAQRDTVFKGESLRGMLLNAYGWWKMGQIALIAGIASFGLALVMAILTFLGFWHLRTVPETKELFVPKTAQPAGV